MQKESYSAESRWKNYYKSLQKRIRSKGKDFPTQSDIDKLVILADKAFKETLDKAKVILAQYGHSEKKGFEWIEAIGGNPARPVFTLNCISLASNVNAIFFLVIL